MGSSPTNAPFLENEWVICIKEHPYEFTANKLYQVRGMEFIFQGHNQGYWSVKVIDDSGIPNGWAAVHFKKIKDAQCYKLAKLLYG